MWQATHVSGQVLASLKNQGACKRIRVSMLMWKPAVAIYIFKTSVCGSRIRFPSSNQWTVYLQQAGVTNSSRGTCKRKTSHKNINKQTKIR